MLLLASCTGSGDKGNRAPIVLGDTATIITETDTRYTKDLVADLHPSIPTKTHRDEDDEQHADSSTQQAVTPQPAPPTQPATPGNAFTITFKDVSVTIPGIAVKAYRPQDPLKANGVSYQLVSGIIAGTRLIINSGNVQKVSQRYQSQLVVNGTDADLALDNMTTTTDWAPIPANKNVYIVKGLEAAKLQAPDYTASNLRAAISRAARRHRISRKREQEYQESVRNLRKAGVRPLSVALRSVMWKIDGKDASGKQFSKQIRVDVP
jgi:hypothetical protein